MNVEYAEAVWGKSGEGMAEVLMASFGEGIDKVTLVDTEKGPMEQRVLQIGLDISHKAIAVCGDNAPNNDTFCDHFHRILKQKYDDDPALELVFSEDEEVEFAVSRTFSLLSPKQYLHI